MYKLTVDSMCGGRPSFTTYHGLCAAELGVILYRLMRANGKKFKQLPKVGSCISVMQGIDSTIFVEYN